MATRTKKTTKTEINAADNIQYVAPVNEFPFVYANNAVLSVSDLDGSIIFGEVVGKEGEKTIVIPKVKVVMATPFVHRLRDLLNRQLGSGESKPPSPR